jgi:hypothetical protein
MDDELELRAPLRRGASGPAVRRVQEWLTLHGVGVSPDGIFGPATQAAVRRFQRARRLVDDGVVTPQLFAVLVAPMHAALSPIAPEGRSLGDLTVAYARHHLEQGPREVGGDNSGPWVRLYMQGHEGRSYRWCAGFVCFCLQQATSALNKRLPIKYTFSCDVLAESAKLRGLFVDGDSDDRRDVSPGWLFLVRRTRSDWQHVGIVTDVGDESFDTIEGNTNDEGSANGYEVTSRTRTFAGRDFIRIGTEPFHVG